MGCVRLGRVSGAGTGHRAPGGGVWRGHRSTWIGCVGGWAVSGWESQRTLKGGLRGAVPAMVQQAEGTVAQQLQEAVLGYRVQWLPGASVGAVDVQYRQHSLCPPWHPGEAAT